MAGSATWARALSAASSAAPAEATASGDVAIDWFKITVVPLLVFLIGACLWGCIKSIAARRVCTAAGEGGARNGADEGHIDSGVAAADLERGLELSQLQACSREVDTHASSVKAERMLAQSDGSPHRAKLQV